MKRLVTSVLVVLLMIVLLPTLASADGVRVLVGFDAPASAPFPSDRYTEPDTSQNTGLRIRLPKPDCTVRVSDCEDIDLLNTLDGFSVLPRLTIPFSEPIDVDSVTRGSVFLV